MFNLIITIISIALVVAMAAAAVYYGGEAFTQGTSKANAATLVTQAQQINGAITLYTNDNGGAAPASVGDLATGGYLQSSPVVPPNAASGSFTLSSGDSVVSGVNAEVCDRLNDAVGLASAPADVAAAQAANVPYACTADNNFVYKN